MAKKIADISTELLIGHNRSIQGWPAHENNMYRIILIEKGGILNIDPRYSQYYRCYCIQRKRPIVCMY